jgi:hypothetical protein
MESEIRLTGKCFGGRNITEAYLVPEGASPGRRPVNPGHGKAAFPLTLLYNYFISVFSITFLHTVII